jgi:hypothetical protein
LALAMKLNVIRHTKAEYQLKVCKVIDIEGSTVQSILKNNDKLKEC